VIVFDSNFNWNFFDPDHDRMFRNLIREMRISGQDSGTVNSGFMFRGEYMETRPMLGTQRPQWDRNMLIKLRFMDIVAKENAEAPYTDEELVKELSDKGYFLARRTVTKYRNLLGLQTSAARRVRRPSQKSNQ